MKILVTGSKGFIGQNLIKLLRKNDSVDEIMEFDRENSFEELESFCNRADAIFHLAAVLRPENINEFDDNISLTGRILNLLKKTNNNCSIMFASSIQADLENPYGQCKRTEERALLEYGKTNDVNVYLFRFPNLFGTMSRPNYTSVIATFCYNTIKGLPISVNNPAAVVPFAFVEKVLEFVIQVVLSNDKTKANSIISIQEYYPVGLGELTYYMQLLKKGEEPPFSREDDFFIYLKRTYEWYENYLDKI